MAKYNPQILGGIELDTYDHNYVIKTTKKGLEIYFSIHNLMEN